MVLVAPHVAEDSRLQTHLHGPTRDTWTSRKTDDRAPHVTPKSPEHVGPLVPRVRGCVTTLLPL